MDLGDREAFTVAFARGRRAFQPQHVEAKWARDRAANINHIKLEVALDFDAKKISGTATHRLSAITGPLERLEFDAAELEIKAVRAGGEPASFETADGKLLITLPRALGAGEEIEIAIDYAGQPRRGLYFVGPDDAYPKKAGGRRGRRAKTRTRATGFPATTTRTAEPPAKSSPRCRKNSPRSPTAR